MLADITYIGDRSLDEQLGCPVETHGCFYSFADDAGAGQTASPTLWAELYRGNKYVHPMTLPVHACQGAGSGLWPGTHTACVLLSAVLP